jgi:hypothetical protein
MGGDWSPTLSTDTPVNSWLDEEGLPSEQLLILGLSACLSLYLVILLISYCGGSAPPKPLTRAEMFSTEPDWLGMPRTQPRARLVVDPVNDKLLKLVERLETQMQRLEHLLVLQETVTYYHQPSGAKLHTNPHCGKSSASAVTAELHIPQDVDNWLYQAQKVHCSRCHDAPSGTNQRIGAD